MDARYYPLMEHQPTLDYSNSAFPSPFGDSKRQSPPDTISLQPLHSGSPKVESPAYFPQDNVKPFENGREPTFSRNSNDSSEKSSYRPLPFRTWFGFALVTSMVLLCVLMEVLLAISNNNDGFTNALLTTDTLAAHYFYTIMAVVFSLPVVACWTWFDYYVKAAQPYIDLKIGSATADRTLLINYTAFTNFWVPFVAFRNKHYLTLVSAVLCLLTLVISPIAASLFYIEEVSLPAQNVTATTTASLGFSPDADILLSAAGSAGYVLSQALYSVAWPTFFNRDGATTPVIAQSQWGMNGSVNFNTVAVQTPPNCQSSTSTSANNQIVATNSDCTVTISGTPDDLPLFGVELASCASDSNDEDVRFQSVAFWATLGDRAPVVFCTPSLEVRIVDASLTLGSGNLTTTPTGMLPPAANTLLSPPLNGRSFNGLFFLPTSPIDSARISAAQLDLATSFARRVQNTVPGGIDAAIGSAGAMLNVVTILYRNYLNAFAATTYFLPQRSDQPALLFATQPRLKVGAVAAHILAALFALLAVIGAALIVFHTRARRGLRLAGEPGTIGSAVSIAGGSELAYLIEAKDDPERMARLLRNYRFGLDEKTGRIVIDGEVISPSRPRKRRSYTSSFFSKPEVGDAEVDEVLRERRSRHSMSRTIPE